MKKITILLLFATFKFYGQWTNTPQTANAIVTGSDVQQFAGLSHGQHSVIVDNDQNIITAYINPTQSWNNIYLQKTDIDGNVLWGEGGIMVYDGAYTWNGGIRYTGAEEIQIVADGTGGVIIAFRGRDYSNNPDGISLPAYPWQIMAIRVDGEGNQVWNHWASISTPSYAVGIPDYYRIIPDGNGGAFAGWITKHGAGNGYADHKLFFQHLNADGTTAFPEGKLLKTLNELSLSESIQNVRLHPVLAKLPSGNVAISWKDHDPNTDDFALFCHLIDPQGNAVWPNDVVVDTNVVEGWLTSTNFPHQFGVTDNGVFCLYSKINSLQIAFLSNDGTVAFSGLEISNAWTETGNYYKFDMTTTPTGEAMVAVNQLNEEPYLQKVNQQGQKMFGIFSSALGPVGASFTDAYKLKIVRTSDNNYLTTFIALFNGTGGGWKAMAALNDVNGTLLFPYGGTVLLHDNLEDVNLMATNDGGAVLIGRYNIDVANSNDIFALKIKQSNNPLEMAFRMGTASTPMETTDNLNFTLENYTHVAGTVLKLRKYDIANMNLTAMPSGYASYVVPGSNALPAGTYNFSYNAMTNYYEFESTLGVPDNNLESIKFYPNPAVTILNVSQAMHHIEIFNVLGHKILEISEPTTHISVENFSSGIYLLKGQDAYGQTIVTQFIKR
ncbi:MAG TPA: T9SS type A sorting domain-containing protein [Flavobacterium sp.]|jgi:hypothetical protein